MKRNQEEFFGEAPQLRGQYNDRRMKINKENKIRRKKICRGGSRKRRRNDKFRR